MWEKELLDEVRLLREEVAAIKVEMGVFKVRVGLWSAVMAAIPIVTAVALVVLKD